MASPPEFRDHLYSHSMSTVDGRSFSDISNMESPHTRGSRSPALSNRGGGNDNRCAVMARYLYKQTERNQWMDAAQDEFGDPIHASRQYRGVIVRSGDGNHAAHPQQLNPEVARAIMRLDSPVGITMSSTTTAALLGQVGEHQKQLSSPQTGETVAIVDSVESLASGQASVAPGAVACICRAEQFVLVWSQTVESILTQADDIETFLVGLVWGSQLAGSDPSPRAAQGTPRKTLPGIQQMYETPMPAVPEQPQTYQTATPNEKLDAIQIAIAREEEGDRAYDPERDGIEAPRRPFMLTHAVFISIAMALVVVVILAPIAKLITEARLDGNYTRFALISVLPVFFVFSLFFMIVVVGSLFQLFGPLAAASTNSLFYSAKAPKIGRHKDYELPHVTIQMPVYKEGLKGVIIPTIESCMEAVKYYEQRGGSATILVCDDGMQVISAELAEARKAYYEVNNIGWCSRPPNCSDKDDPKFFIRKGKFKKASNMNYCLDFSGRVEDEWLRLIAEECRTRGCTQDALTIEDEEELYNRARETEIVRDNGQTWAAGDVRIGELILIIDSDTRIPADGLLYGALEMHESPEVALLQHTSGVLQVANNVFENGITYFTNLIYTSIAFAVGSGDVAPFMGHNTFIRWKALQAISWEEDGKFCAWASNMVSEDFDLALRLQINDYIVRLCTYEEGAFKEGVSLTVYDELARWEKYAYGCNELVFHPFKDWWRRGPITPLFRKFLGSNMKATSKVSIVAYIFTYYAIACAIPLVLANYFLVGWLINDLDQFYFTSWKIFVGMVVVFNLLSPLGYAMLRHRLGYKTFFKSLLEAIKWTPFFLMFFGGLSFHLLKALSCHALSIDIEWTATAKELESTGFRVGLDRVVRDFKAMYAVMLPLMGGMIYLAVAAPWGWGITDFTAIVPLANQVGAHLMLPFVLGLF